LGLADGEDPAILPPVKHDLASLPQGKQDELAYAVDVIRQGFAHATARRTQPHLRAAKLLKIVLFGSYARGTWVDDPVGRYFSDYDLLIVSGSRAPGSSVSCSPKAAAKLRSAAASSVEGRSVMAAIRLAKLPDRTAIKLTISVLPELQQQLVDYAAFYRETYGTEEPVVELIPAIVEAFLQSDKASSNHSTPREAPSHDARIGREQCRGSVRTYRGTHPHGHPPDRHEPVSRLRADTLGAGQGGEG
jgi:predicted nucleotidyltransferase